MPQPPAYVRQTDFSDFSASNPSSQHSGASMDAEFDAIKATFDQALTNLALIQKDDGTLKNAIVGVDQLSTAVVALLSASAGWTVKGAWITATAYVVLDVVTNTTGTYICAVAHTSGTFATDLAAGKWVTLYDSAGSTPADGSVTTPKLADGAVTTIKIGFTGLDLSGAIRGATGIQAGTAALTELLAAKKSSGDVIVKAQRATQAQGIIGYRLEGGTSGLNWDLRVPASSDVLEFYDGTSVRVSWTGGTQKNDGTILATSLTTPAAGTGAFMRWSGSVAEFGGYNYAAGTRQPVSLSGSTVKVYCGGVEVISGSSTNVNFPVEASVLGEAIGYRGIPVNAQNGAYTVVAADNGKCIYSENSAPQTITIPQDLPVGMAFTVTADGTSSITLDATGSMTLVWTPTGATGDRTLADNGEAFIHIKKANRAFISGTGLS